MSLNREDAYYEPEDCNDAEEFQERVDHQLKHENYPYSEENITTALENDAIAKHLSTLATLLKNGQTAEAGLVLSSALYTYWEQRTEREVQENI